MTGFYGAHGNAIVIGLNGTTVPYSASKTLSNVKIVPGGKVQPQSGVTITIASFAEIPAFAQWIDLSAGGTVEFAETATDRMVPQWWGAVGDGVANDRPEIQYAIDAASVSGCQVFIPPGDYLLGDTTPLSILSAKVEVVGVGSNISRISKTLAGDMIQVGDGATAISEVKISGLQFSAGAAVGWCINVNWECNQTHIFRCRFSSSSTTKGAINIQQSYCCRVSHNLIRTTGVLEAAVKIHAGAQNTTFADNRVDGFGTDPPPAGSIGLYLGSAQGSTIHNNVIEGFETGASLVGDGMLFSGGYFENCVVSVRTTAVGVTGVAFVGVFFGHQSSTTTCDFHLINCNGIAITGCKFVDTHSSNAPIVAGTAVENCQFGPNYYADTSQVAWGTITAGAYVAGATQQPNNVVFNYDGTQELYKVKGLRRVVYPRTDSYTVADRESFGLFTNTGESNAQTVTLPVSAVGRDYLFTVTAGFTMIIDTNVGDAFRGRSTGKYMSSATLGDWVHIWCAVAGTWEFERSGVWFDETQVALTTKTTTYTATYADKVLLADATGAAFTITLPTATNIVGYELKVKNIGVGNDVTLDAFSTQLIDGAATLAVTPGTAVLLISDGTGWRAF